MLLSIMGCRGDLSSLSSFTLPSFLLSMLVIFSLFLFTCIFLSLASSYFCVLCISLSLSSMLVMNFILSSIDSILILSPLGRSRSLSYSIIFRSRISKSSCNSSNLLSYFSSKESNYLLLSSAKSKSELRFVNVSCNYTKFRKIS
jgi:hypothetical protein